MHSGQQKEADFSLPHKKILYLNKNNFCSRESFKEDLDFIPAVFFYNKIEEVPRCFFFLKIRMRFTPEESTGEDNKVLLIFIYPDIFINSSSAAID